MTKEKKMKKEEIYLNEIFLMIQKAEKLTVTDRKTSFNNIEMRLIGEILSSAYVGRRLISTQLATRLGVTRSAISQIVNKLEERGVVKRVSDSVDRKIAYIELTEESLKAYKSDMKIYINFIGRIVEKFGVERFDELCSLFNQFCDLAQSEKKKMVQKDN